MSVAEKKFFAGLGNRLKVIEKVLKNNAEVWKPRYEALEDLERICEDGIQYDGFKQEMQSHEMALAECMEIQMGDLRSEIVRQAAKAAVALATHMGQSYKRMARRLMPKLIEVSASRNGTIRTYAAKCVPTLLENTWSKGILFSLLDALSSTKNKMTQEQVAGWLNVILLRWPESELAKHKKSLQEAIAFSLRCPTAKTRTYAVKCFWSFVGHFPDSMTSFMDSLDARSRRIVEKGKTEEEEKQEHTAATKIGAAIRGAVQRKRFRKSMSFGKSLAVDSRVIVGEFHGTIKFIGPVDGKAGQWYGIETDEYSEDNLDGSVGGKRYFQCEPGHGLFARLTDVQSEATPDLVSMPSTDSLVDDDEEELQSPRFAAVPPSATEEDISSSNLDMLMGAGASARDLTDTPKTGAAKKPLLDLPVSRQNRELTITDIAPVSPHPGDAELDSPDLPGSPVTPPAVVEAATSSTTDKIPAAEKSAPKSVPGGRTLSASNKQEAIDASDNSATAAAATAPGTQPKRDHRRVMSVADQKELMDLNRVHKQHLQMMGQTFQQEMDVFQQGAKHDAYVTSMIDLLDKIVEQSSELRRQFQDYQRRVEQREYLDDDFLNQADNFGELSPKK